jgi:hypothetical protein
VTNPVSGSAATTGEFAADEMFPTEFQSRMDTAGLVIPASVQSIRVRSPATSQHAPHVAIQDAAPVCCRAIATRSRSRLNSSSWRTARRCAQCKTASVH